MKQVVDKSGSVIPGLFKDGSGAIIVDNPIALKRNQNQKQSMDSLLSRIERLEAMLNATLNKDNKE